MSDKLQLVAMLRQIESLRTPNLLRFFQATVIR